MPIVLAPNSDKGDIVQAVNYLLGTQAGVNSVVINTTTGAIINPYTQQNVGYAFKYMFVAYGTSNTGENFSLTPTNATYYGVRNTDSTILSTNPADYSWSFASPAFGTTNFLYYSTIGGRQIQFNIDNGVPGPDYEPVPNGSPINLDIITSAGGAQTAITVTGNAQPNITSVGTLNSLSVTGNVNAGSFFGNGFRLSNLNGANITGSVANATYANTSGFAANATYANTAGIATYANTAGSANIANTAGTVTANAQANITSVGTLTSLITGPITLGDWTISQGVGGNLVFAVGAGNRMALTQTGNLVISGLVTTSGSPS